MPQNRLIDCTSPYLQQHADNPVEWHPWDKLSLQKARSEGKPILLSIGYSACHWCHVMAHESFENKATAAVMNELFVNIKVDREERPDLDKIYQSAHQMLAQRPGGWPLTVFLTPDDHTPFFAGTYFPDKARHGLPPFVDILKNIASAYHSQRSEIDKQNRALLNAFKQLNPQAETGNRNLNRKPLKDARQQLEQSFDENHGGFGPAPKFPHPTNINRLLRHWAMSSTHGDPDQRSLYLAEHTLSRMALGGINDQLGGGFCRYSVDEQWMIPHFEKMLYDNGPLLGLYAEMWQVSGKDLFKQTAEETAEWVIREMQSPQGGYYSTLDADSEGKEGRYYVWQPDEVKQLISEDEYLHFNRYYGLDREANFESAWHLHNFVSIAVLNEQLGSSGSEAQALLASARTKLNQTRQQRIRPGRDEKILTAWNALMVKGMARAGRLLNKPKYIKSAEQALAFIRREMWHDGRLFASHKDGKSAFDAYLDDYAFLIDALLELLQARWNSDDLDFATVLADRLLTHFQDGENGGFFFTADDHEELIHRPKPLADESTPAGNGVTAKVLIRLGHLLGNSDYLEAAEKTLKYAWPQLQQAPYAHCTLLDALEMQLDPGEMVIIRGAGEELNRWQRRANQRYAPLRYTLAIDDSEEELPESLAARKAGKSTTAYLCRGTHCEAPNDDFADFEALLSVGEAD